jgi:hypothetical protein
MLLQQYSQCIAHMNQMFPGSQNELFLFHGTSADALESINQRGFDRSMAGKHATALGSGTYFARDALYSCNSHFSPADSQGFRYMYRARVAVGRFTRGTSGMRAPPRCPEGSGGQPFFDSVVDSVTAPTMFCVFRDAQSFPDYVIKFCRR